MPNMIGIQVCDELKNKHLIRIPILMLTALGTKDDIVNGSHTGANDDATNHSNSKNIRQQKCIE